MCKLRYKPSSLPDVDGQQVVVKSDKQIKQYYGNCKNWPKYFANCCNSPRFLPPKLFTVWYLKEGLCITWVRMQTTPSSKPSLSTLLLELTKPQ